MSQPRSRGMGRSSCRRCIHSDRNATSMRSRQSSGAAPAPGGNRERSQHCRSLRAEFVLPSCELNKPRAGVEPAPLAAPGGDTGGTHRVQPKKPRKNPKTQAGGRGDPQSHQCQLRPGSSRAHLNVGAIYILDGSANALWQKTP